jgi:8-amino-7-oxononanoate synthase
MSGCDHDLLEQLAGLEARTLRRRLRPVESPQGTRVQSEGRPLLNFSSNDYLGLATHPALRDAASRALERYGTGSGASRLISGSLAVHQELEEALADWKGTQAALTFSSGYATALGVLPALVGTGDIIVVDRLAHASLIDGARLSGAKLRVFRHNDLNDLERILRWTDTRRTGLRSTPGVGRNRVLVVTESLFSMDGDAAPLRELVRLKETHGAWLMVDEAHATGLHGDRGRGLVDECGVTARVEVQMSTLGKALGSAGGAIAGSRALVDYLVNAARSFVFSTAPPPSSAAAARAGIDLCAGAEGGRRRAQLRANIDYFRETVAGPRFLWPGWTSAILPVRIGLETEALAWSAALNDRGLLVPAIRYPTVARGQARLRVTLSAAHGREELDQLATALRDLARIR